MHNGHREAGRWGSTLLVLTEVGNSLQWTLRFSGGHLLERDLVRYLSPIVSRFELQSTGCQFRTDTVVSRIVVPLPGSGEVRRLRIIHFTHPTSPTRVPREDLQILIDDTTRERTGRGS